ncbi:coiled-coil domain-containing protein 93-like [Tropilaelaps mercedesae]|uniref:Coiled-coil domain-containing protein 93 n=1 Tax=Tropilaelaps mercedesae TaxID=418985 RepID=A0A1V9XV23_9ACAR|nr:coiled-coil domain-containing protein 93-like [Tropilaelaps mercedesae]
MTLSVTAGGPVAGPNFREDELQAERGEEIVQLLLAAGYFRARIKGLSLFDKVVGGLVWCIQICAVDIEVELLFNENWNIGTKIALTEKIVRALRELQCPHPIEPHQIQGKDHIHVFPVVQWLVKRALETREQTAQYHSRFAQYQLEKNYGIALTSQPKPVEVYRPVRTYRHIAPDTLSKELLLDAVLLEYSQKETTGGQDDERSSAIAGEMRSVDHVSEVSQNIEEGTEKLKKLVGRREKEISEGVDEWRELRDGEEDEMERRKNRVLKEIGWRERRLEELREKVKERREEVKSARRRMEETREEAQRMRALKEKENEEKAFLDVCESLQVLDEMKKQEGEFKKECRRELERLQQMVAEEQRQGEDGGEESQAGDERIEQEFAQVSQMKVKIAKLNRQVGKLQRAIDQIPTRSELGQFQRRFVELHQQMADVHKETKQYYTMFNTMNDLCAYLEKEIGLLNSIQDNFTQAMGSSASREMFLGQVEASVQGIRQNRLKTEKRRHEAKMERDKLQYEYLRLVEKQRLYVKMVADFKEELRRNQALMASKSQQPLTE